MKRRDFSLGLGSVAGSVLLSPALAQTTTPAQLQGKRPEAGRDYLPLDKPAPVETPAGKIEVVEFFWYNCPHCNSFEPTFDAWSKRAPKDVVIRRVPIAFRSDFGPQQRLYYALEAMGLVEKLHAKVFYAIHVERKRLDQPEAVGRVAARCAQVLRGGIQRLADVGIGAIREMTPHQRRHARDVRRRHGGSVPHLVATRRLFHPAYDGAG